MLRQKTIALSIFLVYLSDAHSGTLITKCNSDDSNCLLKSGQALLPNFVAGLPEYSVQSVDPITLKSIDASSNNLKFTLSDVTVTGLRNCNLKKIKRDKPKNKLFLKILCSCQLDGQYEMDGQLLVLPIKGKGPIHVTLKKAEFDLDVDIGEKEKNGDTYWDIKGWKYTSKLKDKSNVVFENLFDGNEVLAQAAGSVIAESGNEIITEVGPPVLKAVIQDVVYRINSFFHKIPAKDLSLD